MASVVGITAYLQAKNGLSPEIENVVKATRKAAKEMLGLDDATQDTIKEMRKIKHAAEQAERGFKREFDQMQREIQELRRQLGGLDSTRANPTVSVNDQARREIAAVRQELKALDGAKAKVHIEAAQAAGGGALLAGGAGVAGGVAANVGGGSLMAGGLLGGIAAYGGSGFLDRVILETQANARHSIIATSEELQQYKQMAKELALINPNVDKTYVKDLMTQAIRFDSENGAEITRQALQLNAIRPDLGGVEDYQKTMFAMQQSFEDIKDVGRFGDTLAEIARTTTDIRGEALDSIVEYSTQVTKFLDTPEKLAALMKEMNDIWSLDKGFDALKETTLKLYNQGDLTNVLKTAYETQGLTAEAAQKQAESEAKKITELINSGSVADQQFAVGALMQQFGGIQDQKVLQNLLNELGAGPGEDLGTSMYAKLIEAAGTISMADPSQFNYQGRLDSTFNTYAENDPLREFLEAKSMLSNELISLGVVIADDFAPAIEMTAEGIKKAKELIDEAPIWVTLTGLGLAIAGVTYGMWKLKIALSAAEAAAVRRALGGSAPDIDLPDGPDKNSKSGKGGRGGKRRGWNPLSWGGNKQEAPPKRTWLTAQEAADMAFGKTPTKVEAPKKASWLDNLKSLGGTLPKGDIVASGLGRAWESAKSFGSGMIGKAKDLPGTLKSLGGLLPSGDTVVSGLKSAWEGVKSLGSSVGRKIPVIGIGIGASQILTAEDKLEMAGRVGSEALGAWGGAAAGAAVGSVVPLVGTAVGGIVGGIAGAFGGGALFDKVLSWWNDAPPTPPDEQKNTVPPAYPVYGPPVPSQIVPPTYPVHGPPAPIPPVNPVGKAAERPQSVSLTIPQLTIPLHAEGVLQDVPTMLRLLDNPSVSQKVKDIIEKALIDALETRGGVAT